MNAKLTVQSFSLQVYIIKATSVTISNLNHLFSGKTFWVYNGEKFIENSPQPLSKYGVSVNIDHIDAAMVWGKT